MRPWPPRRLFSHILSAKPIEVTWPHVAVAEEQIPFFWTNSGDGDVSIERWRELVRCAQLEAPLREVNFNMSYQIFTQALNPLGNADVRRMRMGERFPLKRIRQNSAKLRPDKTQIMLVCMNKLNIAYQSDIGNLHSRKIC
eukprot:Gregarina_sp_Poly_1__2485@NODE_1673_length_3555_cov_25_373280_g1099_i0_p1_GENE_NODE_1673_length_3555_cov_25_373280_g1099_i0NODE_1673_length_3555_cov_25_373280_g1099_i0_p1_ORF_typecomplete_len141_score6_42_NODE_1673_length_3555_cov_25_373280_g1099_i030763498